MDSRGDSGHLLPWSNDRSDQGRFGLVFAALLVLASIPALVIPRLELASLQAPARESVAPQVTRLIRPVEQRQPIPPAASAVELPAPAIPRVSEPGPEPEPDRRAQTPRTQTVEQARQVASRSGLLALQSQLAEMKAPVMSDGNELSANVSSSPEEVHAGAPTVTADALSGSGGVIESDAPTRKVLLSQHTVAQVEAPVVAPVAKATPAPVQATSQRAMSNIRQVFEAQKSALYALYRRELRQNPALEGKLLLELIIEPDGRVSHCKVVSSELANPSLEQRVANRVLLFDFGASDVEQRTVRFPIDFLPS
ncbi:AgmX/PglI C-terminal domain-containing protein [Marinobacter sp. SS21]|uniref:AgmX/PglI C-terminal domain-containing protein n=1 Tax=Marinobacter sp. SS21 TaxID=2979460 RepID=UPI00232B441B|nr:AgmX/PglI C-terminal domain-containing protein [Marinobacter sp. SS21]MDC0661909.1 AgmX/PglI C-terminal domain-containing protein [Marinobacter sp. SS21]